MSLTVESISPVPIAHPNLPIALRPAVDFPPLRGSVFDDPGDEKSWRISQRAENLSEYYAGREPSWYTSAVAPLQGADRVLDLGCGPGLALRALRDQGSSSVLGVDRWPAFVAGADPDTPIVAHDLSLPMPFLESQSFDGVFSHYALDYVSPICVRQVLREAYRVLRPGGLLVVHLAAIGLAGGDVSRTVAYTPQALRTLLAEAGFEEMEVEASSNGRNTTARARRATGHPGSTVRPSTDTRTPVDGDTQLCVSFTGASRALSFELSGDGHRAAFAVEPPPADVDDGARLSACARALSLPGGGVELQLWVWRGFVPLVAEQAFVEFPAAQMRIVSRDGAALDASSWSPEWLSLEPPGDALVHLSDLPPGADMTDAGRVGEGRRIVVDVGRDEVGADARDRIGSARNRFMLWDGPSVGSAILDREWLDGRLDGVAVDASRLAGDACRELLSWVGRRQALLYLRGADWNSVHAVAERRRDEMPGPVVLVDPGLSTDAKAQPLPRALVALAAASDRFLVLLGSDSQALSRRDDVASLADRLLLTGVEVEAPHERQATENLRYVTERLLLTRLRQLDGHTWHDVGRRAPLR